MNKNRLHNVNVVGTRNLLDVATSSTCTKAFIYTSSIAVHAWSSVRLLTKEAPLLGRVSTTDQYAITKAIADASVLSANCAGLRTACLRLPAIYGERDVQLTPESLEVMRNQKTNLQLGDNANHFDAVHVANAAMAHLLAVTALLKGAVESPKVDGETFFVTDDNPMPFWDFQRKIWAAAGDTTSLAQVRVIPVWVGMVIAGLADYLFWILTFGQKQPPKALRGDVVRYATSERTFSINKAKASLGYRPLTSTVEGIKRAVNWALQHDAEAVMMGKAT